MIALKHPLPLVRGPDGNAVALNAEWLRITIRTAALKAGYPGMWQVDDLVAGISLYLGYCDRRPVIELSALEEMIRLALCKTGFHEVASQLSKLTASQNISLVNLLENSASHNDEEFFGKLSEVIVNLEQSKVQHFSFHDLEACAERLPLRSLSTDPQASLCLKQRIVEFVRQQVQERGWDQEVWCSIA